jgi:7-carboxy-7-deazaguanine synthase
MNDALPVNEIFQSIQGEATHAGRPAVFIRLQGCAVGCPWCDTKYTWAHAADAPQTQPTIVRDKTEPSPTWAPFTPDALLSILARYSARHIVITGGEPCVHDLTELTTTLIDAGYSVQIETSGTQPIRAHVATWVTVSPKIDMPGGFIVRPDALGRADEIKMPIGRQRDIKTLQTLLAASDCADTIPVWLQPLSQSPAATETCRLAAIANNWRISLQLHAYAGWR